MKLISTKGKHIKQRPRLEITVQKLGAVGFCLLVLFTAMLIST